MTLDLFATFSSEEIPVTGIENPKPPGDAALTCRGVSGSTPDGLATILLLKVIAEAKGSGRDLASVFEAVNS